MLDGRFVGFHSDIPVEGEFPDGISPADSGEFGVCVSSDPERRPFDTTLNLVPMDRDTVLLQTTNSRIEPDKYIDPDVPAELPGQAA